MIKAQELRINNLVKLNGIEMRVVSIHDDGTVYCDFDGNEGGLWGFDDKNPCDPIPLTEEIILKSGFKEATGIDGDGREHDYFTHKHLDFILDAGFQPKEYSFNVLKYELEFLHQLQNLYFAITGKELEVKL